MGSVTRPHQMHPEPGKVQTWRCAVCCRMATNPRAKRRLEGKQCHGHLLASPAAATSAGYIRARNHRLLQTGTTVWCRLCGGHTHGQKAPKLLKPCSQEPCNSWTRSVLKRMLQGKHPRTGHSHDLPTTPVAIARIATPEALAQAGQFFPRVQPTVLTPPNC